MEQEFAMPDGHAEVPPTPPPTQAPPRRRPLVDSAVLGTLIFICTELMFFSGLLSAYNIARARVPSSIWPPPDQPRLPVEATAFNTGLLLLSGVLVLVATEAMKRNKKLALPTAVVGWLLGAAFVALQGREWADLLSQGMRMQNSSYASFFYLIVGTHALHAIGALVPMAWVIGKMATKTATLSQLRAAQVFWSFVVLVWPVVYTMVYL
jgi:heme/copper-type cytochrome/quinol oxidase subunit 3